jgi:tetratricopeptide (TPR) repeat protein
MEEVDWETLKNEANADMKLGGYLPALSKYERILAHCESRPVGGQEAEALRSTQLACLNNAGMAYLRLEQYDNCVNACTKGLDLDDGNLKARYRRAQAYYHMALGESEEGKIRTTTTAAEADSDEFWGLSMRDITELLQREPESKQGKDLKKLVRDARHEQQGQREHIRKYGTTLKERPDAPGSVFQGFPEQPSSKGKKMAATGLSADGTYDTTAGGSKAELAVAFETAVAKDLAEDAVTDYASDILGNGSEFTRREAELAAVVQREQEQRAESEKGGYSFLDPSWSPPTDDAPQSALLYTPVSVPASNTTRPTAAASTAVSQGSGLTAGLGGGTFKDLLKKARKKTIITSATKASKKKESAQVVESLAALQAAEEAAANKVIATAKEAELLAAQRTKGQSRLENKSDDMRREQERLKKAQVAKSAWAELMEGEGAAQQKYREQLQSRPDGQVTTK